MVQEKGKSALVAIYSVVGVFIAVFLITISIFVIFQIRNSGRQYDYIGRNPETIKTMTFRGEGTVNATPDIAIVSMGLSVEKTTVSSAQQESSKTMNSFIAKIKEIGIESKDIKTQNYSIYPQYDYSSSGKATLRGYQITQNVEVKIRNLDKISSILDLAGEFNLNQVGNLSFDVDKKDQFKEQAKEEAIKKAKANAESTAKSLGISLGRIVSYDEYSSSPSVNIYNGYALKNEMAYDSVSASANVESGNAEIKMNVGITYEIN